jgi:hypothetical protein
MPNAVAETNPNVLSQRRAGMRFNPAFADMVAPTGCRSAAMIFISADRCLTLRWRLASAGERRKKAVGNRLGAEFDTENPIFANENGATSHETCGKAGVGS